MKPTQKEIIASSSTKAQVVRYRGTKIRATIDGADCEFRWTPKITSPAALESIQVFTNGQRDGLVAKIDGAALRLSRRFKGVQVVGWRYQFVSGVRLAGITYVDGKRVNLAKDGTPIL